MHEKNIVDKNNESCFMPVKWKDVRVGEKIYLLGTHLGSFHAYGPHEVICSSKMLLKNVHGVEFLQYQEILGRVKEEVE